MKYRTSSRILSILASVLLLYCIFAYAFEAVCYWLPNWYRSEYEKYNVLEDVRGEMSMDDAVYVTEEMLQYLRGNRDDLVIYATIDGKRTEFYSDREKAHLADCRNLIVGGLWIRRVSMAIIFAIVIWLILSSKKPYGEGTLRTICSSYIGTTAVTLVGAGILGLLAMSDFTDFFDKFHLLFFDNDLYILDPREDNLINLLPEGFFSDTAAMILGIFLVIVVILLVLAVFVLYKDKQKKEVISHE